MQSLRPPFSPTLEPKATLEEEERISTVTSNLLAGENFRSKEGVEFKSFMQMGLEYV